MTEGDFLDVYLAYGTLLQGKTWDLAGDREKALEYYRKAENNENTHASVAEYIISPYVIE